MSDVKGDPVLRVSIRTGAVGATTPEMALDPNGTFTTATEYRVVLRRRQVRTFGIAGWSRWVDDTPKWSDWTDGNGVRRKSDHGPCCGRDCQGPPQCAETADHAGGLRDRRTATRALRRTARRCAVRSTGLRRLSRGTVPQRGR